MTSIDALGPDVLWYLAGALTTIAFVPQVVRIVRTRSARRTERRKSKLRGN